MKKFLIVFRLKIRKEMRTTSRYKRETDKSINELWKRIWDLQNQTNKIKKAVLTGQIGDLKMPEEDLEPGTPIFSPEEMEKQRLLEEIIQHNKRSMNNLRFTIAFLLVMLVVNLSYLFYQISIALK